MNEARSLTRGLGLLPAIAVNVGNVIGTGIFLKTRVMTCNVGAASTVVWVWVIGGLLALAGAFAYSEVAALMPEAGGEYAYVRRAYGRHASFLCGWTLFTLQKCGGQAALAVGFAIFMNAATGGALEQRIFAFDLFGHRISVTLLTAAAVASIWMVALINARSVARCGETAFGLTSVKVGFLLCLAFTALLFGHGHTAHFGESNHGGLCEGVAATARGGLVGLGAAVLGVLWAYDGWSNRQLAQSALAAGFKNVFLMGDHGGNQDALRAAAKDLENPDLFTKLDETAHVYYVPDLYYKEKEQMKAYLAEHGIPYDAHAATDDTSEVMFLDEKKWIRRDKLALSTAKEQATTGVDGDPTKATPELGKMFIGWKIDNAVNQIHELLAQKK
jgi:hypothetical protein